MEPSQISWILMEQTFYVRLMTLDEVSVKEVTWRSKCEGSSTPNFVLRQPHTKLENRKKITWQKWKVREHIWSFALNLTYLR